MRYKLKQQTSLCPYPDLNVYTGYYDILSYEFRMSRESHIFLPQHTLSHMLIVRKRLMHALASVHWCLYLTYLQYAHLHTKFASASTSTSTYTKSCPRDFLFISTLALKHLIYEERESHENHWSAPFIFGVHAGYEKSRSRWRGGSSHVNLIDYLKGRSDLVNTQALLSNTHTHTHTHTYIKEHAWLFEVFFFFFFYPTFHQSEIFSKNMSSWINIC